MERTEGSSFVGCSGRASEGVGDGIVPKERPSCGEEDGGACLGASNNEIRRNNKSPWICQPCSCIKEQKVAKSVFIDDLLLELEFFLMK